MVKYVSNVEDMEKILVITNFQFKTFIEQMRGSVIYVMRVKKNLRIQSNKIVCYQLNIVKLFLNI